jgi:hypothetical protein
VLRTIDRVATELVARALAARSQQRAGRSHARDQCQRGSVSRIHSPSQVAIGTQETQRHKETRMMGSKHFEHLMHCLRSKAAKDMKANEEYAMVALRRLRLGKDCERILQSLSRGATSPTEIARDLGWDPPLVVLEPLDVAAKRWLDKRSAELAGE